MENAVWGGLQASMEREAVLVNTTKNTKSSLYSILRPLQVLEAFN